MHPLRKFRYASPEMLEGRKYTGPESDVWSLGIILHTLLVGCLPFDDDDELVMIKMICKGEFADPTWLTEGGLIPCTKRGSDFLQMLVIL